MALFMRLGVKSVNMDDVARHLGVSKKRYTFISKTKKISFVELSICIAQARTEALQLFKKKIYQPSMRCSKSCIGY